MFVIYSRVIILQPQGKVDDIAYNILNIIKLLKYRSYADNRRCTYDEGRNIIIKGGWFDILCVALI